MAIPDDTTETDGATEHRRPPLIPDHEVLRHIGSGAYGDVWLARSVTLQYRAVKLIYRDTFESSRPFDKEFTGVLKFEPISRTHEGFVDVLHVGRNDEAGYFYYVMELGDDQLTGQRFNPDVYRGKTLYSEIKTRGKLPFVECVQLGLSLSAALSYLHEKGLIHRDIKHSNIIFVDGVPKLADIGLVTGVDDAKTFVGTEGYIPPEGPGTAQADLYSLGKVIYEASTGKDRLDFPELPTDLGETTESEDFLRLNEVILKACENDPAKRYQTAKQMHADFERLAGGLPRESIRASLNNLPAQLTSFVGRENEIAEVRKLLKTTRLLTLTGVGGCGKTRLALEVASSIVGEFPDGVWLVELAALSDPALVIQAGASVLGVREEPNRPLLSTLSEHLRSKRMLLLLDNCEHLIQACAEFAEVLLKACPNVGILVMSREGLGIGGETIRHVRSLSTPAPNPLPPLEQLAGYEAVRLFVERAVEKQLDFAVTTDNAVAVAQICKRLDGIPLAIELAAARLSVLSPEQIAERLDDRFRLLTGGSRTALPRQQTLQALMDWSYELLSESEQSLLRCLSVFAGGWTLGAAEAMGDHGDVMDLLSRLVDKSLVVAEKHAHEIRYRFLETVRQYAWEKATELREANQLRERHLEFFLNLAEQAEPQLTGKDQQRWLDRLESEHDNFRTALALPGETGPRVAAALWRFWYVRGYFTEGRLWLEATARATADDALRAKTLKGAGVLAYSQADYDAARQLDEQALALFRKWDDKRGIASVLNNLGLIAHELSRFGEARQYFQESLSLLTGLDERGHARAVVLNNLGLASREQNDYVEAKRLLEEGLRVRKEIGDQQGIGESLYNLGVLEREQGRYESATAFFREALANSRSVGDKRNEAWTLTGLAELATSGGDFSEARALVEASLKNFRAVGDQRGIASGLNALGILDVHSGNLTAASAGYDESLRIFRRMSDQAGIASVLDPLASLALNQGNLRAARRYLSECLQINRAAGSPRWTARSFETFAVLALAENDPTCAAKLGAAAAVIRETIGAPLPPNELAEHQQHLAEIRQRLGDQAFAVALAEGRAIRTEQAVTLALADS